MQLMFKYAFSTLIFLVPKDSQMLMSDRDCQISWRVNYAQQECITYSHALQYYIKYLHSAPKLKLSYQLNNHLDSKMGFKRVSSPAK